MTVWTGISAVALLACVGAGGGQMTQKRYYAHEVVEDPNGVVAPWYHELNGQVDFRIRIAAETLKRYPWADSPAKSPHYVFNGTWRIAQDGTITIPSLSAWDNGDLGQRAAYVLSGLVDYYRYTGDAAAIAHITLMADSLLDWCVTPQDHPWPGILVSVPNKGKPYGRCDPHGMIQLDIVAEVGIGLVRAYELTGNKRWWEAAKHWGDLLAEHRRHDPGLSPWNRYANPEDVAWEDQQTGGAVFILAFFDELIRAGHRTQEIKRARADGVAYLRDVLLPRWTVNDTWGRNYWDWPDPVQAENVTEFAARYLMEHPREFPNWRNDARNILTLFLNRTSVSPSSRGDVFSGAWAYPESAGCCGRSLWYGPLELAPVYAQYAALTGDEWMREMARRQMILATYDAHETGVVEDNIDGGPIVADAWFKIAHPMALKHCLNAIAWMPELFGANRENHIVRTSSVVGAVEYARGRVSYSTFDASAESVDVLRLAFTPTSVRAGNQLLDRRDDLRANGFTARELPNGDCILTIRHDGAKTVVVEGEDPQQEGPPAPDSGGVGRIVAGAESRIDETLAAPTRGRITPVTHPDSPGLRGSGAIPVRFTGSQVRVIGTFGPDGGLADVYLDDVRQLVPIDCWNPSERRRQVLYYRNGLGSGPHTLRIVPRDAGNPVSKGSAVRVESAQWSEATGDSGFGEGGGPTGAQRVIFGFPGRTDYADSEGHSWRPATELITRTGDMVDSVAAHWWTAPRRDNIAGTKDPALYRYGVHAPRFTYYFTVGPGTYHVRLKFAETRAIEPAKRAVTIAINGEERASQVDLAATAGGMNRAVDLVFDGIHARNGVIAIEVSNASGGEAILQAAEIGPGAGGPGAKPVFLPGPAQGGGK